MNTTIWIEILPIQFMTGIMVSGLAVGFDVKNVTQLMVEENTNMTIMATLFSQVDLAGTAKNGC